MEFDVARRLGRRERAGARLGSGGCGVRAPRGAREGVANGLPGQALRLSITTRAVMHAADDVFDRLMGSDVEPRKRFIQTHARSVRNLDV